MKKACSSLLLCLASGAMPLLAQQAAAAPSLEQELMDLLNTPITVASKSAESVNAAPGIVSVVSRVEIEGFAAQNLGQVLSRVVGMNLLSPDVFPNQSLVIRGQETTPYNNHVLVLLNGRPMRDPITGGLNGSYWNSFPLATVERIEIIRGPGSVLYGSCAYSGVVNIVTKTQQVQGIGGAATLTGASFGGFGQSAHLTFRQGDFNGIVGISHFLDDGPTYSFVDYNGQAGSGDFYKHTLGATAHMEYKGFTVNAYHGNYEPYSLEGGSESWVPGNRMQQITTHGDLGYSADVSPILNLGANLTYNRTQWYTGVPNNANPAYPLTTTEGHALLFEAMARIKPTKDINLLIGGGYEKADWGQGLVVDGNQASSFLYLQADWRIQAVKLIGGVQYNKLENIDGNYSPRLGAIWDFTPEWGTKLLYSTAFRKGYPNETGFNHPVFRGNSALKPELIDTYEAQLFHQGKTLQGSLTFFKSQMKDIVTRSLYPLANPGPGLPPFYFKYGNGGTWDYSGVELEARYTPTPRLLITGSVSYQQNKNQAGLEDAALHPNTMAKAGVLYTHPSWSLGLFDSWWSEPHPTTLVRSSSQVVNPVPEATHMLSAKFAWKALRLEKGTVALALEGYNLLDQDVRYPDYPNKAVNSLIPISGGRSFTASISWVF